jgi:hypothetical protein
MAMRCGIGAAQRAATVARQRPAPLSSLTMQACPLGCDRGGENQTANVSKGIIVHPMRDPTRREVRRRKREIKEDAQIYPDHASTRDERTPSRAVPRRSGGAGSSSSSGGPSRVSTLALDHALPGAGPRFSSRSQSRRHVRETVRGCRPHALGRSVSAPGLPNEVQLGGKRGAVDADSGSSPSNISVAYALKPHSFSPSCLK